MSDFTAEFPFKESVNYNSFN